MGRYWVPNGHRHLASDEWLTPPWMLEKLGPFDLDPCAPTVSKWGIANKHYTIKDDGLSKEWTGKVWLNPPYGRMLNKWIVKLANHNNGIAIFPLRSTDSGWFHDSIWDKCDAILFVRGRIRFYTPEGIEGGPCPHASIIVAWGENNAIKLKSSGIKGHFILNHNGVQ
jgi:phage N-6-adenine-methyltransferase